MPIINYRRGFHRIFFVCAVLWVGGVLAIATINRPQPTNGIEVRLESGTVLSFPLGTKSGVIDSVVKLQTPPNGITLTEIGPGLHWWELPAGIALVPVAVLYFVVFIVIPWIHRGFRSERRM